MTATRPTSADDGPLDELDLRILAAVRDLYTAADPVPANLVDQVRYAVALADVPPATVAVCRQRTGSEKVGTITFDGGPLTISIGVRMNQDGTVRVDGELSPPGCHPVELRTDTLRLCTMSDSHGQFTIDGIGHGPAHLMVSAAQCSLTTPAIVL